MLKKNSIDFSKFYVFKWFICKVMQREGVKCSVAEKRAESELFTVVVVGTRRLRSLVLLKAPSQKVITVN